MEEEKKEIKEERKAEKKTRKHRKPKKMTKGRIIWSSILMMLIYTSAFCYAFFRMQIKLVRQSVIDDISYYYTARANSIIDDTYEEYEYSNDNQYIEMVEKMYGGKLTPEQKEIQRRNRMMYLTARINSIKVHDIEGIPKTQTIYTLYDEDLNEFGEENEVIMLTKIERGENDWEMGALYYTFYDDESIKIIKGYDNKYFDKKESAVFHIDGAYLKDFNFVPDKLVCYIVGENGEKLDELPIYETEKSREEMEADGYTYFDINDSFQTSDSFDNETHVAYLELKAPESSKGLARGIESIKTTSNSVYVDWSNNDIDMISVDCFYIKQHRIVGTDKTYWYAIYAQENILYRKFFVGFGKGITLSLYAIMNIQIAVIAAISIMITLIHITRQLRSFQPGE